MPAARADQRRQRIAVKRHQAAPGESGQAAGTARSIFPHGKAVKVPVKLADEAKSSAFSDVCRRSSLAMELLQESAKSFTTATFLH